MKEILKSDAGIGFSYSLLKEYAKGSIVEKKELSGEIVEIKIGFMDLTCTVKNGKISAISYQGFQCLDDDAFIAFIEKEILSETVEAVEAVEVKSAFRDTITGAIWTLAACAGLAVVCWIHAVSYVL